MSKHKKRKNVVNKDGTISEVIVETDETSDDTDIADASNETIINSDILVEDTAIDKSVEIDVISDSVNSQPSEHEMNDKSTDVQTSTETIEINPIIEAKPVIMQQVNFYKVGTDYINGKCINQVTSTTDLILAKKICSESRDTYKKSYHIFDKNGSAVYTSEYSAPKDNYYRVGTDWKNNVCINQKFSSTDIDLARDQANINTKTYGVIYNVYDPSGKVVFSSKKKLTLLSLKKRGNKNDSWYT